MKTDKQVKLVSGQENVLYFKLKVGYAKGAKRPKRVRAIKNESISNGVILRKSA
jgi:hypothetical protein